MGSGLWGDDEFRGTGLRAGLSVEQLMHKYQLSVSDLCQLVQRVFEPDAATIAASKPITTNSRSSQRFDVNCGLVIQDVKNADLGLLGNICDQGFMVRGLASKVGEFRDLVVVCDWRSFSPTMGLYAICRWVLPSDAKDKWRAGYEIQKVTEGSFPALVRDIHPDSRPILVDPFALFGLHHPHTKSVGPVTEVIETFTTSLVKLFRLLNHLPFPCLVTDSDGVLDFINTTAFRQHPPIAGLRGRHFADLCSDDLSVNRAKDVFKRVKETRTPHVASVSLRVGLRAQMWEMRLCHVGGSRLDHVLAFLFPGARASEDAQITRTPLERTEKDVSEPEVVTGDEPGHKKKYHPVPGNVIERPEPGPVGQSDAIKEVMAQCGLAAQSDSIVLLEGESGSGKDFLAAYIHRLSKRSPKPFRCINCAAIPSELAESELFGHEAGAFTGADRLKRGLLELGSGGTVLLNEIGELPMDLQAKLLSFLDTKSFWRLGGQQETVSDIRIMAATNRDLQDAIKKRHFRQDLFYRLNVLPIRVPPLRERLEDLHDLVRDLCESIAEELGLNHVPTPTPKTMSLFKAYWWPGNIRELQNLLRRAIVQSGGKTISITSISSNSHDKKWILDLEFNEFGDLNEFTREVRRRLVVEALSRARGKRQAAAKLLGISRYALKRHMTNLGLMGDSDT